MVRALRATALLAAAVSSAGCPSDEQHCANVAPYTCDIGAAEDSAVPDASRDLAADARRDRPVDLAPPELAAAYFDYLKVWQ